MFFPIIRGCKKKITDFLTTYVNRHIKKKRCNISRDMDLVAIINDDDDDRLFFFYNVLQIITTSRYSM